MITYKAIENWWANKENKNKVAVAAGFVVIFFVGFGVGAYEKQARRELYKSQPNYTTVQSKKPALNTAEAGGVVAGAATSTSECIIKGNISAQGKKIYHVKGGAFYARVKPEQCFNTEEEAIAAGFVKSSR